MHQVLFCACCSDIHSITTRHLRNVRLCACVAGIRGFRQGLLARTLTIVPGAAIQWFIYERVKLHLQLMGS